jgi:hypothetical protein
MKTQEEIEQLAKEYSDIGKEAGLTYKEYTLENIAYIKGYTQSQEDMADKKYTEEDMIDAIIYGSSLTTSNIKLYAHNYINSLNKQD